MKEPAFLVYYILLLPLSLDYLTSNYFSVQKIFLFLFVYFNPRFVSQPVCCVLLWSVFLCFIVCIFSNQRLSIVFSSAQCFCEAPPPGLHFQPPKHPAAKFICNQQRGQICCCFCFMFLLHFLYIHFLYILYIPLPAPKTSGSKIYLQSTIWPAPRYAAFLLYLFVFFIFYTFICCFIILDLQHPNIRRPSLFAINNEARYAAFLLFLLLLYFHMLFYTTRPAAPQNIRRPNY